MTNQVVSTTILARGVGTYQAKMAQAATANARFGASAMGPSARMSTMQGRMGSAAVMAGSKLVPALIGAAGVKAALNATTGAAIEWESAFAGVKKTVEGTPEQLAAIDQGLRGLSMQLPTSATELAGIAEAAGQLGIETGSVLEFTETMAALGETTNLSADQAATELARFINIMGSSQDDVDRLGSVLVELGNNSGAAEAEILGMSTRLAAAGRIAGLSESDVMAFASTLTSVGVEAQAGGTALSKVFIKIRDATLDGGEALDEFARVAGMSSEEFQAAFSEDAAGTTAAFIDGLGKMNEAGESTTAVFETLELTDQRLMRALLSTASAGGLLTDQLEMGADAYRDNIALTKEFELRLRTSQSEIDRTKNILKEMFRQLGEGGKSALDSVLPPLNNLAADVGSTTGELQGLGFGLLEISNAVLTKFIPGMKASGASVDDMRAAMQGNTDQQRDAEAAMRGLTATGERYTGQAEAHAAALQETFDASVDAADGTDEYASSLAGLIDIHESATEAVSAYNDAIRAGFDPVFAVQQATQGLAEAQEELTAVMEDGEATQADRETALMNEVDAALILSGALRDLWAGMEDGTLSSMALEEQLEYLQTEFGLSREAAQLMLDKLNEYSDRASSLPDVEINAIDNAGPIIQNVIDLLGRMPTLSTTEIRVRRTGASIGSGDTLVGGKPANAMASGGPVSAGRPYIVGENQPELFIPDVSGRIVPEVPNVTGAGMKTSGGGSHTTIVQLDGRTVAKSTAFRDEFGNWQAKQSRLTAGAA